MSQHSNSPQTGGPKPSNNLASAVIPKSYKKLRACRSCRLIKSEDQFLSDGCENCPNNDYQDMDCLLDNTCSDFQGMIAMMQAKESWVAKWTGLNQIPGIYAISVYQVMTNDMQKEKLFEGDQEIMDDEDENSEISSNQNPKNLGQKR